MILSSQLMGKHQYRWQNWAPGRKLGTASPGP